MAGFRGFPPQTFSFLGDLRANNSKDWFDGHKDRYEAHWKAPALDFIEAIAPAMRELEPPLKAEARLNGSLRRINRDVRFSTDKSPYQPHLHLIFWAGEHPNRSAGFHFVLNPEGIGYGVGHWALDAAALERYRQRVCEPAERAELLEALAEAETVGCRMDAPHLARVPRGWNGEPEWDYLLRYKGIVVRTMEGSLMPDWIATPQAPAEVMARAERLQPLVRWLHRL